ncbi:hypothetical protein DSUL_150100 [Desulfovibrionales bacterium]
MDRIGQDKLETLVQELGTRIGNALAQVAREREYPRLGILPRSLLERQDMLLATVDTQLARRRAPWQAEQDVSQFAERVTVLEDALAEAQGRMAIAESALTEAEDRLIAAARDRENLETTLAEAILTRDKIGVDLAVLKETLARSAKELAIAGTEAVAAHEKVTKQRIAALEQELATARQHVCETASVETERKRLAADVAALLATKTNLEQQLVETEARVQTATTARQRLLSDIKHDRNGGLTTNGTGVAATAPIQLDTTVPAFRRMSGQSWAWLTCTILAILLLLQGMLLYRQNQHLKISAPVSNQSLSSVETDVLSLLPAATTSTSSIEETQQLTAILAELDGMRQNLTGLSTTITKGTDDTTARLATILGKLDILSVQPTVQTASASLAATPATALRRPLRETILFESGEIKPSKTAAAQILLLASQLKASGANTVLVVGHADDLMPRGILRSRYKNNVAVSQARAESVALVLAEADVNAQATWTCGAGAAMPITINDTMKGRARNRRVEIIAW